jgi:hypothetical protein
MTETILSLSGSIQPPVPVSFSPNAWSFFMVGAARLLSTASVFRSCPQ